jgi:hypothetical protein
MAMEPELIRSGIRWEILHGARKGAGLLDHDRREAAQQNGTLVSLHFESLPRPGINGGMVYHGPSKGSQELAERLCPILTAWGTATSQRYQKAKVLDGGGYPILQREDATMVIISPFSITGPDSIMYSRRLFSLGGLLAGALASWAIGRNPGGVVCYQPLVAQSKGSQAPEARDLSQLFRGRSGSSRMNDTVRRISVLTPDESSE